MRSPSPACGYVYPDDEEDAFFDIGFPSNGSGDAAALLGYANALACGWANIPELPNQIAVDNYNQDLNEYDILRAPN